MQLGIFRLGPGPYVLPMPTPTTASDIMRRKLVTLSPETPVMDAVASLLKHSISGAPVVDRSDRLLGILSELDCTNHLVHCIVNNEPVGFVQDLMTQELQTVGPDATLLTLAHHFNEIRIRRLPVVNDEGMLLGQVSRRDLMKALHDAARPPAKGKAKPLFLSAIYASDDLPARLDPNTKVKT